MVGRNLLEHPAADNYEFLTPSSQELNLLDRQAVATYIQQEKPDLVIHAAGKVGGIQANMSDPMGFLVENTLMGIHVINEAQAADVPYFINLSSSCMYPREAANPLQENKILTGELEPTNEGYALAKITATRLCQCISENDSSKKYITLIPCNLYGRHDNFDPTNSHLIPSVVRKIHHALHTCAPSVEIWGDGEARREFMYADDLADCIFMVIEKMVSGVDLPSLMNVGIDQDFSINQYYQTVANVLGYQGEFVHNLKKPVGMRRKLIDSSRVHDVGWHASTTLQHGIEKTYQYFLKEVIHG